MSLNNPYNKFRDHEIKFNYDKVEFKKFGSIDIDSKIFENDYIQANKKVQFAVYNAAIKLYLNNPDPTKNILLEFTRNLSNRYYKLLKSYNFIINNNDQKKFFELIIDNICHDGVENNYLGNLGSFPHTWVFFFDKNQYQKYDHEAEFRHRLFFVYKLMGFVNNIINHEKLAIEINKYLKISGEVWQLDLDLLRYLRERNPNYLDEFKKKFKKSIVDLKKSNPSLFEEIKKSNPKFEYSLPPPIFRWGTAAAINDSGLRLPSNQNLEELKNKQAKIKLPNYANIIRNNNNISVENNRNNRCSLNSTIFNLNLSDKELIALTGETKVNIMKGNLHKSPIGFFSGNFNYNYNYNPTNHLAKKYLQISKKLYLPIESGISGSMDLSLSMSAIVGLGIKNKKSDYEYQQIIKLSYIVWMTAGYDHTLHEMLFSSLSYGLSYIPGPYIVDYVFPNDPEFKLTVEDLLQNDGSDLPSNIIKNYIAFKNIKNNIFDKYRFALECIATCTGIARMISYRLLDTEISNIKYPERRIFGNFPVNTNVNRSYIYNLKKGESTFREINPQRGTQKKTRFTKKLSTTLMRPDGNIRLYYQYESVGLMFNMHALHNKGYKYVFKDDALTNLKWWLGEDVKLTKNKLGDRSLLKNKYIDIDQLRSNLLFNSKEKKECDNFNEIMFGLCKEAFIGLFIREADVSMTFKDIYVLLTTFFKIKTDLGIYLPLFNLQNPSTTERKKNIENRVKLLSIEDIIGFLLQAREDNSDDYKTFIQILLKRNFENIVKLNNNAYVNLLMISLGNNFIRNIDKPNLEKFYQDKLRTMYDYYDKKGAKSKSSRVEENTIHLKKNNLVNSVGFPPSPPDLNLMSSMHRASKETISKVVFKTVKETNHMKWI